MFSFCCCRRKDPVAPQSPLLAGSAPPQPGLKTPLLGSITEKTYLLTKGVSTTSLAGRVSSPESSVVPILTRTESVVSFGEPGPLIRGESLRLADKGERDLAALNSKLEELERDNKQALLAYTLLKKQMEDRELQSEAIEQEKRGLLQKIADLEQRLTKKTQEAESLRLTERAIKRRESIVSVDLSDEEVEEVAVSSKDKPVKVDVSEENAKLKEDLNNLTVRYKTIKKYVFKLKKDAEVLKDTINKLEQEKEAGSETTERLRLDLNKLSHELEKHKISANELQKKELNLETAYERIHKKEQIAEQTFQENLFLKEKVEKLKDELNRVTENLRQRDEQLQQATALLEIRSGESMSSVLQRSNSESTLEGPLSPLSMGERGSSIVSVTSES